MRIRSESADAAAKAMLDVLNDRGFVCMGENDQSDTYRNGKTVVILTNLEAVYDARQCEAWVGGLGQEYTTRRPDRLASFLDL